MEDVPELETRYDTSVAPTAIGKAWMRAPARSRASGPPTWDTVAISPSGGSVAQRRGQCKCSSAGGGARTRMTEVTRF